MFKLESGNFLYICDKDQIMVVIPNKYSMMYVFGETQKILTNNKMFTYSGNISKIEINTYTSEIMLYIKKINQKTFEISTIMYADKIDFPYSLITLLLRDNKIEKSDNYMINNLLAICKNRKEYSDVSIKNIALFGPNQKKIDLYDVYKTCCNRKRHHICDFDTVGLVFK